MSAAAALLAGLAIVAVQMFYGGLLRPVFAIPGFLILGGAAVLAAGSGFRRGHPPARTGLVLLVLALAGWMLWRCGEAPATAATDAWVRLVVACLAAWLLFAAGVPEARWRLAFLCVLMVAGLVQAATGAFQFLNRTPDMPFGWMSEQLRIWYGGRLATRAHGFYINANHLAWFLNLAGLGALAAGCWARWPAWARVVAVYVAAACLAGCLPTLSRGGFLGLLAGLSAFLLASGFALALGARGRRIASTLAVGAGVLVAGGAAWFVFAGSFTVQGRLALLFDDSYRPAVFEAVSRQFQLEPLTGGGPGAFERAAREFRVSAAATDDIFAHNDWAQLAADFGFPALALLVLFAVATAASGISGLAAAGRRGLAGAGSVSSNAVAVQIAGLSGFAACATHSFFDFNMQIPANALLAAAFAGLLANPGLRRENAGPLERGRSVAGSLLGGMAGAVLVWLCLRDGGRDWWLLQAENALLRGEPAVAASITSDILADAPHQYEAMILRARALLDTQAGTASKNALQAARELEEAARIQPLDSLGEVALAAAYGRAGRSTLSRDAAARAVGLHPLNGPGYEYLAMAHELRREFPEAARLYGLAAALPGGENSRERLRLLREAGLVQ